MLVYFSAEPRRVAGVFTLKRRFEVLPSGASKSDEVGVMRKPMIWVMLSLAGGWILIAVLFIMLSGGWYSSTTPNDPVDTTFKINPFTGGAWLAKTYSRQLGNLQVLAAREADIEETKSAAELESPTFSIEPSAAPEAGR